ncbi:MAG: CRISPR-associated endonuclease Cas1 [Acidobacteria bacterium]|nr:CRISPR-associated endonuclease Cas1 [Acidobacteriota bacterium]
MRGPGLAKAGYASPPKLWHARTAEAPDPAGSGVTGATPSEAQAQPNAPTPAAPAAPAPPAPPKARRSRTDVSDEERTEHEIPFFRVGELIVPQRGVTLSTDLIAEAVARGIPITFVSSTGQPYAMLTSPMLTATVRTRRAQLRALDDARGVTLARAFVAGKLRNQASLLVYFAKAEKGAAEVRARVQAAAEEVRRARKQALAVDGRTPDHVRLELLGIEGNGARAYWGGVRALLEGKCEFAGRGGRGSVDPVNALLNYGYGILASRVWAAVMLAGLDPFAGLLHVDRPGKPSMVLDLMEELRAPVVDRAVLAHVRLGQPVRFENRYLSDDTRRAIADAVLERLEGRVTVKGERHALASVVQQQARRVASFVRGEAEYRPFAMTW